MIEMINVIRQKYANIFCFYESWELQVGCMCRKWILSSRNLSFSHAEKSSWWLVTSGNSQRKSTIFLMITFELIFSCIFFLIFIGKNLIFLLVDGFCQQISVDRLNTIYLHTCVRSFDKGNGSTKETRQSQSCSIRWYRRISRSQRKTNENDKFWNRIWSLFSRKMTLEKSCTIEFVISCI